jgi:peptidoglycan DL-endopeptidase CwlO
MMSLSLRTGASAVAAAIALVVPAAPAAASAPSPGPTVPSASEVSKAQKAAAAVAAEVAEITAEVEAAQARLETLQRAVSESVAAHEQAEEDLSDAEAAVRRATLDLALARSASAAADRALSGSAALMYMQGGDLQSLTTLLLSPPGVMSDLSVVMDQQANGARETFDAARAAAAEAKRQEFLFTSARDGEAALVESAETKRVATEKAAAEAGEEAAELGERQEALTARLAELEQGAADLAGLREAAASLGGTLIGVQASGTSARAAQEIARTMVADRGWGPGEFTCLVTLWHRESGWSWSATNPSSGAYGIPQSLPGWKMASAGSDWLTNPATQISWGLGYIDDRYGSPCRAYEAFLSRSPHWY